MSYNLIFPLVFLPSARLFWSTYFPMHLRDFYSKNLLSNIFVKQWDNEQPSVADYLRISSSSMLHENSFEIVFMGAFFALKSQFFLRKNFIYLEASARERRKSCSQLIETKNKQVKKNKKSWIIHERESNNNNDVSMFLFVLKQFLSVIFWDAAEITLMITELSALLRQMMDLGKCKIDMLHL